MAEPESVPTPVPAAPPAPAAPAAPVRAAAPAAPAAPPAPPEPPFDTTPMLTYMRSDEIGTLAGALAKAQGAMRAAVKDSQNPHFKSQFASLGAIWDACREALSQNELAVTQMPAAQGRRVLITTMLMHSSGQWIESTLTMTSGADTPQGIGGTITYARRYALAPIVGVAVEDDDGTDASKTLPQGIRQDAGKNSQIQTAAAAQQPGNGGGAAAVAVTPGVPAASPIPATVPPGVVAPPPVAKPRPMPAPAPVPAAQQAAEISKPPASTVPPPPPGMKPPAKAPGS